jgi:hypothetical protein
MFTHVSDRPRLRVYEEAYSSYAPDPTSDRLRCTCLPMSLTRAGVRVYLSLIGPGVHVYGDDYSSLAPDPTSNRSKFTCLHMSLTCPGVCVYLRL